MPSQLYGVGPGTNVTISCNVQAYPTAINYWMKDDNEMLLSGYAYFNPIFLLQLCPNYF